MAVYLQILLKRWLIILLIPLVAVGVVTYATMQATPVYRATSKLLVIPFGIGRPDYGTYLYFEQVTNTLATILNTATVIEEAKEQLGVERLPTFTADVIPRTDLFEISVTHSDPELAQRTSLTLATILVERARSQYGANLDSIESTLGTRVQELEREISDLSRERAQLMNEIPLDTVRVAEIDRSMASRQRTYELLLASYSQALVAQTAQSNLVSLFEPATLPSSPSGSRPVLAQVGAAVGGLVAGVALAFILENLNPRMYSETQIEQIVGARVIVRIPRIRKRFRGNVFEGDIVATESFRRLRTSVLSCLQGVAHQSVLIVSSQPDTGKSVIAANLAAAIAYNGHSVLLIDTDIRKPTLHRILGLHNECGLSSILNDEMELAQVLQVTNIPGLYVMTAGPYVPNAAELLGSTHMHEMIDYLHAHYDFVVIDSASIVAVSDASILAPLVGGVVFVVNADSDRRMTETARQEMEKVQLNLMGVVVNGVRHGKNEGMTARYKLKPGDAS